MRILVLGASGLLGLNFCLDQSRQHTVVGVVNYRSLVDVPFDVIQKDLAVGANFHNIVESSNPDLVVNCAALANVDQCERTPEIAERINAVFPGEAAAQCAEKGIPFIHISTDAVFDGTNGGYREEDLPNPLSVYGCTKWQGEKAVARENQQALIARVNFFGYSISGSRSLAEYFINQLSSSQAVHGFTDVLFCPLYVRDLVKTIMRMAAERLSGLYHVVSVDRLSKYDFGKAIAARFGFNQDLIQPIRQAESRLIAPRSLNLTLSVDKLSRSGITLFTVEQGIDHLYKDYLAGRPEKIMAFLQEKE